MDLELKPHQKEAVEKLENGKILWGDVGVGKTFTALAYYYQKVCGGTVGKMGSMTKPRDIIVITTAKTRDGLGWPQTAAKFGISTKREFSVDGVQLTVDSWNNIGKYEEIEDAFFVFDEQRVVGSGAWTKSFIKIAKSNGWILLSATPGDTWMDYIPVFIANGFYKNKTAFINEHVVWSPYVKHPKVLRYTGVGRLVRHRNNILVEMPYDRHTVRHIKMVDVEYDTNLFERVWKDRWHVFEERPLRDVAELFIAMRRVVNSDSSRLKAVQELLTVHPRLIVFYNFDYELEQLRTLRDLNPGFEVAEWNGHLHQEIPESDKWIYLVQYVAGAEGWNCISTDAVAFYSMTYSYKNFHQAMGRIDRLNTPFTDLYYYILRSTAMIDQAIWKALKTKKSFNERKSGIEF